MANDILKTLIAEAYGEGPEGMRRVAETIINRAAIRGLTPEQVVRQANQYTGLTSPGPDAKKAWNDPQAIAAAQAAWELAQQPGDPTQGADHYYAQGTIAQPWWASSMTPKGEYGGHTFFSSRPIPPGELPEVATALSTAPTPRAPTPVTPSIDMAQMRRTAVPTQLIPDTFASLSKSSRSLADEIAMSPIQGGQQKAPMFDAAYDTRTGQMRLTRQPIDSQGIAVGSSKEPAPIPATPSAHLAALRATDPTLQAALNAKYPAQLPPLPRPQVTTVASYSTKPQVSGMSYAGQEGAKASPAKPDISKLAALYAGGGPTRPTLPVPDRLPAGFNIPGPGDLPSASFQADPKISSQEIIGYDAFGKPIFRPSPVQVAKAAPVPFPRPFGVGTALDVKPMPPMPVARPARAPMPATPRPLRITVAGANPLPVPMSPVAQLQARGMTAAQAYDTANALAAERARNNAGSGGYSNITSGDKRYDATTGNWV